jgi:hypothetical protein
MAWPLYLRCKGSLTERTSGSFGLNVGLDEEGYLTPPRYINVLAVYWAVKSVISSIIIIIIIIIIISI